MRRMMRKKRRRKRKKEEEEKKRRKRRRRGGGRQGNGDQMTKVLEPFHEAQSASTANSPISLNAVLDS